MRDPFEGNEKAFDPMFTEDIVINTKDGKTQTLKCFVADDITADPMSDDLMDTQMKGIAVSFNRGDWAFIGSMTRGDKLYRAKNNKHYIVSEVLDDLAMGFIIKAREIKA